MRRAGLLPALLLLLALAGGLPHRGAAQQPAPSVPPAPLEPLRISELFVAPEGWPLFKGYLGAEAAGQARAQTLGQQIPARLRRTLQLVQQDSSTAVVAVELRDSAGRRDFYLHFGHAPAGWRLVAIRSLAMTHLGPPMVGILAAMPPAEVADYNRRHPDASHAFALGNLRLWTSADADIAAHFRRNRAGFARAARLVQARQYFGPAASAPDSLARTAEQRANDDPAVRAQLQPLFISRVSRRDTGCPSCLEFVIGGLTHHTVGLLYEPQEAAVPPMRPDGLMVLRPLGNGWYLYKNN